MLRSTDNCSFSSFVESHGRPLLDLSLYVSSENYTAITRPLYNTIQSFPLPYLTPNSIRAAAKIRTEHLNLSGLDIDTEDGARKEHSIIPESLRTSRTTVTSLLAATPETNARIRLDALARDFLQPLQDLLGKKKYLASDEQLSSLDCLALGYLSLMLIPELPQPWLSKTMRTHFQGLCAWTQDLREEVLGPPVTVDDAFLKDHGDSSTGREKRQRRTSFLPWEAPHNGGVIGIGGAYLSSLADSIPLVGQYKRSTLELQHSENAPEDEHGPARHALTVATGLLAGIGLLVGYMFHQGFISLGNEEPERQRGNGLDAFGEAGAALSVYANQMDAQVQRQKALEAEVNRLHTQPVVEVDIGPNGTVVKETTV